MIIEDTFWKTLMFVSSLTSFVSSLFLSILLQFFNKEITDKIPSYTEETIVFIYLAIYTLAGSVHQTQFIKNLNFVTEKLTCRRHLFSPHFTVSRESWMKWARQPLLLTELVWRESGLFWKKRNKKKTTQGY